MCDTAVVVRPEGVLFAKNSDRPTDELQILEWQPARAHDRGSRLRCTGLEIPQAPSTYAVALSRPAWCWGAEIAANQHGVTIGNEAVFTGEAVPARGLTGMDLVRLAAERSRTASDAVELILALIRDHGQGGGCYEGRSPDRYFSSFLIADRRSAFVLETAATAHAVEEVRGARSISNGLTIPGFASRYREWQKTWGGRCRIRKPRTEELAGRAREGTPLDGLRQMFALLRDHGPHADAEPDRIVYDPISGAMRGACMHGGGLFASMQSNASWAAWLGDDGDRHFVTATPAPCTSLFKPIDVTRPPALGADSRLLSGELFAAQQRLQQRLLRNPSLHLPELRKTVQALEAEWIKTPPDSAAAFRRSAELVDRLWEEAEARLRAHGHPRSERPLWLRNP